MERVPSGQTGGSNHQGDCGTGGGDGREGFVVAQLAITDPNKVQSRQDARRVNLELADELGLQVARLFDEYITNPLGRNLR